MKIIWNIPNEEQIVDRLEELYSCLQNFPESKLADVWRNAIAELEEKLY